MGIVALGRVQTLLGSKKNSKSRVCEMPENVACAKRSPQRPAVRPVLWSSDGVSALLGAVCDSFTWV